ncbi:hypothetical protein NEMBOFW57_006534 [Staphylotrichum longicolle]|uniref:Uncharacterized protein n=1 Tax=Staphylotrichum longicolle TaxID=669026 RepID=A0AAD4ETI1_9PEZI|nr:hypothetical protein NEMBOFW57_006534 [Staphylotrichum longicolle]
MEENANATSQDNNITVKTLELLCEKQHASNLVLESKVDCLHDEMQKLRDEVQQVTPRQGDARVAGVSSTSPLYDMRCFTLSPHGLSSDASEDERYRPNYGPDKRRRVGDTQCQSS